MHLQMASNQTTNRHILQLLNWHISRAVHKHSAYTADPATKKQQTSYIRCFKRNYNDRKEDYLIEMDIKA